MAAKKSTYVVAMRGPSGIVFAPGEHLPLNVGLPGPRSLQLRIQSRFSGPTSTGAGVAQAIWVDARGEADDLDAALEGFTNIAREILAIVSVATNVPVGNVQAELGYDATEGATVRDYFQQFLPNPSGRALAPSGDQKGWPAPSVPSSGFGSGSSSRRTNKRFSEPDALNTSCWPSGDSAG